ncbi:MAG: bifunctional proline dehydrogenase/L-glutamate gamma-semialdehyde dehydrogenase PutA [Gammaproteobacteria bacterium]|nr:bifunctional proline dehydrogenase/L-glutamate gamma-semialdehyde dehydrogenase PutA [Gammaproteobacteria bacterium]
MPNPQSVIPPISSDPTRVRIRRDYLADESEIVEDLIRNGSFSEQERRDISTMAADLVTRVRASSSPSMMENFLAEYGLTTREGVALMCLAEALLRVPDAKTIDELIEDKISPGNWGQHLGHSGSPLVNASTWALLLTGKIIAADEEKGLRQTLHGLVKKLGEPLVRNAVAQAMREMGRHFVLGTNIEKASKRASELEDQGYTYSYDMLGEAARTDADARRYHLAYSDAITALAKDCRHADTRDNPGISVKLSALHPRYEIGQYQRVMDELVPRVESLAMLACSANMGFNIDAEEADRLDISLDVIEAVLANPALRGWSGFGVVVQAFGKRAASVLDWLYELAQRLDRRIMVRLVKGAYWDTEIKRAQVLGLGDYPVFTRKVNTDLSYLACARKLMTMTDRIYPQFATHNAHSVAAVLNLAGAQHEFEFQRLHGMGEALHDHVHRHHKARCRIYAPVGEHQDLLAYLVRRLLENGANSSFVNQIVDTSITPQSIARDPLDTIDELDKIANDKIPLPLDLYGEARRNSTGWDITDLTTLSQIHQQRETLRSRTWQAGASDASSGDDGNSREVFNPADPGDRVGTVQDATVESVENALQFLHEGFASWTKTDVKSRADCLRRIAELYESNAAELFALLAREAGKTWLDAVGEVREAVDFARYYASQAERLAADSRARGVIACISPWNFPLAIFSGQIFAALAAGNCVIAKPAEQTSLIAEFAVDLMRQAGIPASALRLLPGSGAVVGAAISADSRIAGVCFTGSTATAMHINRNMARQLPPQAPLIAETGGLNAMIVDSTALPEQVVRDVLASAFQSAGQRCSALRMIYLQEDVADKILQMLFGAMDELAIGNPWHLATDIGPVIDETARQKIEDHCRRMTEQGRMLKTLALPESGLFVAPCVIQLDGIDQLEEEIFGPVLHVARFAAHEIDSVVDSINAQGYGLTFGIHTRVDLRVEQVVKRIRAGNVYVNRNQIGAVVGTQPFGGEGLSGTGPKAGGPWYLPRFTCLPMSQGQPATGAPIDIETLKSLVAKTAQSNHASEAVNVELLSRIARQQGIEWQGRSIIDIESMPGPTGETNQLSVHPRGLVLCLGPGREQALSQALSALAQLNRVLLVAEQGDLLAELLLENGFAASGADGVLDIESLSAIEGIDAVMSQSPVSFLRDCRIALSERRGKLIPLICEQDAFERLIVERHLCIDTTAAGGNASLIAAGS